MTTYSSNEEFFQAITSLMNRMRQSGHVEAADELHAGYTALNGLTDGWAILMESMQRVLTIHRQHLPKDQYSELVTMLGIVEKVVYR